MNPPPSAGLHRFAVLTAACTLFLVVAGALVTSNDAGLAVPDWPLSYGSVMPPMVGGIFYEHGHRLVASFVGLLTIALAAWLWRRDARRWVRRLGVLALAAVMAQGLLGGLTVLFLLPTPVSVAHAALAHLFFCLTVSLALFTSGWWQGDLPPLEAPHSHRIRAMAVACAAAVLVQLLLGAAFRHRGIGILPHLIWAGVVATLAFRARGLVRASYPQVPGLSRASAWLSSLVGIQLVLGSAALWARLAARDAPQPMPLVVSLTVAHVAVGAVTLAAAVVLALCCFRLFKRAEKLETVSGIEQSAVPMPRERLG